MSNFWNGGEQITWLFVGVEEMVHLKTPTCPVRLDVTLDQGWRKNNTPCQNVLKKQNMPWELLRKSVHVIDRLMEGDLFDLDSETHHFINFPENVFLFLQEKAVVAIFAFL